MSPPRGVDRDEIIARTDLRALADELLGTSRAHRGSAPRWPCPVHQPQTGATPPVSIFVSHRGEQRWRCHACGAGGTAIDLLIQTRRATVREAIAELAQRSRLDRGGSRSVATRIRHRAPSAAARRSSGLPVVARHVERCAAVLWTPPGRPVLDWLRRRGFTDQVLRAQAVGADPGRGALPRPAGLPGAGVAAVFPARDAAGRVVYFQARYLEPDAAGGRKYDNPTAALAANPRVAHLCPQQQRGDAVYVTEGVPDAIAVTQGGHRAVAVLGAGLASSQVAERLVEMYPDTALRVCFDADERGAAATDLLLDELHDLDHPDAELVALPRGISDINEWLIAAPDDFATALAAYTPPARAIGLSLHT